jgi:hypothetical protein
VGSYESCSGDCGRGVMDFVISLYDSDADYLEMQSSDTANGHRSAHTTQHICIDSTISLNHEPQTRRTSTNNQERKTQNRLQSRECIGGNDDLRLQIKREITKTITTINQSPQDVSQE